MSRDAALRHANRWPTLLLVKGARESEHAAAVVAMCRPRQAIASDPSRAVQATSGDCSRAR
eukprot:5231401-Alexandrium_andersonii.AAC.1